jgi:hypothetical protein
VSKWTLEKYECYGRVLEDGMRIEFIRKEVKDIIFRENLVQKQDDSDHNIKCYYRCRVFDICIYCYPCRQF